MTGAQNESENRNAMTLFVVGHALVVAGVAARWLLVVGVSFIVVSLVLSGNRH